MLKVSLLTIGNEVVDGQIVNRNAATLSEKLVQNNFVMDQHLSVKDTLVEIQAGLDFLSKTSDLIITTGGLGPTIDDCTRTALANWLGSELKLFDGNWTEIQNKLKSRNVIIRPEHKNQAMAPPQATILPNPYGVAPGFYSRNERSAVAALPGPPRELHGIWEDSLESLLIREFQPKSEQQLSTWICFGVAESEVQNAVKSIFAGTGLDYGFRLSKPYVELKVWHTPQKTPAIEDVFSRVHKALSPWYAGPTIKKIHEKFAHQAQKSSTLFVWDNVSSGLYLEKLKALCAKDANFNYSYWVPDCDSYQKGVEQIKTFKSQNPDSITLGFFPKTQESIEVFDGSRFLEVKTYRNIKVESRLGKLITLERFLQDYESH